MYKIIFLSLALFLPYTLKADIIIDQLINKTHKLQWYMFEVVSGTTKRNYLVNNRDADGINSMKVWNFTPERKWRPISNANSFDGFIGTSKTFTSITMSQDGKTITFGAKSISKNIPLDTYLNDLANKTFDIKWYYWRTANGFPFLVFNRDSIAGISVYQHTAGGKWKPIHNAKTFDGYPGVQSIFDEVTVSEDGREVKIVYSKFNIPTIEDVLPRETVVRGFRLESNDFSDESYRLGVTYGFTSNPHLDWTNVPPNAKSLAIEIVNLSDQKAIWRAINIKIGDSNSSYIPKSASVTYNQMSTLENDYDFKKEFYKGPMPSGDYLVTLYAISSQQPTSMLDAKRYAIEYVNMVLKGL